MVYATLVLFIMGRITEDDVPAKLKARVHKYLVDMGYFDDAEE